MTKTVSGDPSSAVHYVYDNEGRLIAEVDAGGNTIREQVYVNGERVAFVSEPGGTPNEATHFVHNDHLGTPKVVTASDKSVAWQAEYKPFGEVYGLDGSVENDFRFPGQYYDSETGYYYNYFRDYDPEIGRYLESDPIGLRGGMNTFLYAYASPLKFFDFYGLIGEPEGWPSNYPDLPLGDQDFQGLTPEQLQDMHDRLRRGGQTVEADKVKREQKRRRLRNKQKQRGGKDKQKPKKECKNCNKFIVVIIGTVGLVVKCLTVVGLSLSGVAS